MGWRRLLWLLALCPLAVQARQTLTLVVDEAPVIQVLQALAEQQNLNLVVAPGVEGKLTLNLVDVPWERAFPLVLKLADLAATREGNIVQVQPKSRQIERQTQQQERRRKQEREQPLRQQIFRPRYADAVELAALLKASGDKLAGSSGTITADKRTNRLIVRDSREALKRISAWLAGMDLPLGQVELAAHIVTINQEKLRELGVKWSTPPAESEAGLYRPGGVTANLAVSAPGVSVGFNIGRINGRLLELELSALERQQQLEIIASPRLMVAHQQPASIKQGTEIPYQVSSGESGATSVEFKEAVLGMEVTPTINTHGRIRLKLRITQNMPGRIIQQANGEALAIDKQEIETQVEVLDGETLALGGIFQQQNKASRNGVPLLGDIPLFGSLFRQEGKERQRRELVVFITPRLLPAP